MSNHTCELKTDPGAIVFVKGYSSMEDSLFGITVPHGLFLSKASSAAIEKFRAYSYSRIQVPIWLMNERGDWNLVFRQHDTIFATGSLVSDDRTYKQLSSFFSCFTYRDGSRYYRMFFKMMELLREFVIQKKDIRNYPGCSDHIDLVLSLKDWMVCEKYEVL